jgi:hypothetical protein
MTRAALQLTDYEAAGQPTAEDLVKVAAPLSALLTEELGGAAEALGLTSEEILLGALGRALQRTIGDGTVMVDVVGCATTMHPLVLPCVASGVAHAAELLAGVHRSMEATEAVAIHGFVPGAVDQPSAQPYGAVLFAHGELATAQAHLGHVLELRAHRSGDVLVLDWWFDARSFDPYTVAELAEQFPLALIELTSEATPPILAPTSLAMAH